MNKLGKFLSSPFGVFTIICLLIAFMSVGAQYTLMGLVVYGIPLVFIYPAFLILQSFNRKLGLLFACPFLLMGYGFLAYLFRIQDTSLRVLVSLMLIHLLVMCISGLCRGIRRYLNREAYTERKSSADYDEWNEEEDITPAVSIAEGLCELMEKRGLGRFLNRDYTPSIYISYGDYADKTTRESRLRELLADILQFLELPGVVALSIEYVADSGIGTSKAGSYSRDASIRTINLQLRDYYGPNNAVAILCHESTHYFMEHNRLNWNDTDLNEQRTDIAANMIGFNRIMIDGYREMESVSFSGNIQTTTRHKIGYIAAKDCEDLGRFLMHYRAEMSEKLREEERLSELRTEIMKHLETARTLAGYLEYIDKSAFNNATPEKIAELQRILMEMEARNIPAEIQKHEEALKGSLDLRQAEKLNQAVMKLCEELSLWLFVLRQ